MDAKDILRLQEAYLEVHQEQELDEEITPERRAQYKRGLKVRQTNQETGFGKGRPRKRATSPQPGAQHYRKGMTQSHRDTMRDAAREENPERPEGRGSLPKGKKAERQKKTGVSAESYDIYDIILSHLLDEGYAETPEAAEVIMVNMSEDWRDSIVEAIEGLRPASERMKGALTSSQRASQQARARREQKKQEELEKAANAVLNQMSGVSRRSSTPMGSTPAPQKSEAPQANRTIKPKVKRDDLASAANEVLRSLR